MSLKKVLLSSFLLKCIFAISLVVLIFISAISYRHSLSVAESSGWVLQSYKTDITLERIFSYLKDAETAQRGYIITNDSSFIEPYIAAKEKLGGAIYEFEKLVADNPNQQKNLDSLVKLVDMRVEHLKTTLKMNRELPVDKHLLIANMVVGKVLMDNIRLQINKMIELEMGYLKERQDRYDQENSLTPLIELLLLLFALFVFIFSYWKINRDLVLLRSSNATLTILNESTAHAEEIGAFSSWVWNLDTNKLTYSDNQYLLLGCLPQSFEPSVDKFLEFVHQSDKHIITDGENQVLQDNSYPTANFRVIRADGEIRYFKSLSKTIVDSNGKKLLIGINRDITEQHLSNVALEKRNQELEQINKELDTFNYVASHDLQEPLRIVQTYISRLGSKELGEMSDKGKEYFVKIRSSVDRMRILIDSLLLFSRAGKGEKVFEKSDLNILLNNSKQDLAHIIEEKKATIHSVDLPELNVIPFQIRQLFSNLIGNSIRYSKPGVPPKIEIECEKIMAKEIHELHTESTKKYFKISITDNGMGFEQQYSEKIFALFHRLHNDKDFEGTGIGLAICKKILENHGGFITAVGWPNIGATFSVFFPV